MPAKKKSSNSQEQLDFEQSLHELEGLVDAMESGELSLEESMAHFERGIKLTRACQKSLAEAEQKISMLMKTASSEKLVDFDTD